jgi:HSP20 family protein
MAKLVRYTPQNPRSLIESFFTDPWLDWPRKGGFFGDNLPIDLIETDDEVLVKATLPGVKPEEIEIDENQGILTIRAAHEQEQEREEAGWHIRERQAGQWQRSVRLPVAVRGEKAHADLTDGVLTIRLPKVDAGKKLVNRIKVSLPKMQLPKLGKREQNIKISRN